MIRLKNPNHLHAIAGDSIHSPAQITDFHHSPRCWSYAVPPVRGAEDPRPSICLKTAGTEPGNRDQNLSRNPRNARCLLREPPSH